MAICADCQREAPTGALFCAYCGAGLPAAGAADAAEALVGVTLAGRYFLHALIGRGGMGDVYRATELARDRTVVVKVLRRGAAADAGAAQRFHREARAVARLSHPNSVALLDSGETDAGTLYMAMEYVPGATLAHLLAAAGPLPEARAVGIAAQILAALGEAHGLGIIHRDLKPANVMVDAREGGDVVKVLDFGIATVADGEIESRLTQQGTVFGTPAYMSPEQIRGEPLDPRSDLYSVGVMLYEMLTGRLPFEAETPLGLAARHLNDPPPAAIEPRPGARASAALEALVLSALAKSREARPAGAVEFRAALLACEVAAAPAAAKADLAPTMPLSSEAVVTAPSAAVPARGKGFRGRWAYLAGAAAAVGVAALAGLRIAAGGAERERAATGAEAVTGPAAVTGTVAVTAPAAVTGPATVTVTVPVHVADPDPDPVPVPAHVPDRTPPPPPPKPKPPPSPPAIRAVRGELNSLPLPSPDSGDGLLAIEASPGWADVFLDGQRLGETPREVQLTAGRHEIRAVHPELGTREARVSVAAGKRTVWVASFDE